MHSILSKIKPGALGATRASTGSGRPPAAVEITSMGVVAAAFPMHAATPLFAFQALPPDAILPGTAEPNLAAPQAVVSAIRSALDAVTPRSKAVTLILPDLSVRVFVLDFDSLPSRPAEAIALIRFRLRKTVPFEVEEAAISYQVLKENKTECKVLAAVVPGPILTEYENAVHQAGYEPGAVLPSSLAAVAAINSTDAAMAANLDEHTLTTVVTAGQDLLLFRTLELPIETTARQSEVQRDLSVAAAFFEDKLQGRPLSLYISCHGGIERFSEWIANPEPWLSEMKLIDIAPTPETGVVTALGGASVAGVCGALAGGN